MPDDTRYYVRPASAECVAWRDGPETLDREMKDRGFTKVDRDCYRIHRRVRWNGANQRRDG